MSTSIINKGLFEAFMVVIQNILGDMSHGRAAFVQYSECSAFHTPRVSGGVYQVRTKTGCSGICSEGTACMAYSITGVLQWGQSATVEAEKHYNVSRMLLLEVGEHYHVSRMLPKMVVTLNRK